MKTMKLWRIAFMMLAAFSLASCGSDEPRYADPEAHEKTVQLNEQYGPLMVGTWHYENISDTQRYFERLTHYENISDTQRYFERLTIGSGDGSPTHRSVTEKSIHQKTSLMVDAFGHSKKSAPPSANRFSPPILRASSSASSSRGSGDMYLDIAPYIIKKRTPLNILS